DVLNRRGSLRRQAPLPLFHEPHEPHEPHEYPQARREYRIEPKLESVGLFDPPLYTYLLDSTTYEGKYPVYHNVFSFVDALRLSGEDVCANGWWKRCLRGSALVWWTTELSDVQKRLLIEASLDAICQALIDRFKMPASSALNQINSTHFAYQQIRNGPGFTPPSSKPPITSPKPPISNYKPSGYVNRPYAPALKQIENKAYMAGVAGDRAYLTREGQWAYLQYEGDPTNQEAEVEGVE
ncbi:hypothetical protein F5882DRAFT_423495, partial [Hyaloscypha sp. PMI_1271]